MPAALHWPCLCLVADTSVTAPEEMAYRVAAAVAGGVGMVQLRAKEMPGGPLLSLSAELKRAIGGRAALLVNERVDVAAAGAAGAQLGETAMRWARRGGCCRRERSSGGRRILRGARRRRRRTGPILWCWGRCSLRRRIPGRRRRGRG